VRFAFSEEQLMFRSTVRELLEKECTPARVREAWVPGPGRSRERWERLAELGVLGLAVPESHGGLGMDEVALVLVLEECGRAALPEPVAETAAIAAPFLRDYLEPELGGPWLERIASGRAVATAGLASSPCVADAAWADLIVLQSEDELHAVERSEVEVVPETSVDGGRRLGRVVWSPRPETLVVGGARAREAADALLDSAALATSALLVGVAAELLEMAVSHARDRRQFGVPIGSFQAVKHMLSDCLLRLEFARPVVYRAAYSVARKLPSRPVDVSMAKAYASAAATLTARSALQIHGALGYTWEHDLHLWMKKAWALASAWGDAHWHRERVAEAVLGPS
jgi:alkylation response protein AidB-like acyl-CoA dehydrogenase